VSSLSRPIFIVGCPRSGTTLVQCILSASSQAFSLPETHFFSWVLPALQLQPDSVVGPEQLQRFRQTFEDESRLILPQPFWTGLHEQAPVTAREIFVAIVEHHRPSAGDLRAIEKTPRHVLQLDVIGAAFPDAVFVDVVRDPIDVASSLLGVPFESSRSVLSHAQRWIESIHAAQAYAQTHPHRVQTVVYETLVREPEASVRQLCEFVDLQFEPTMLEEFGRQAALNVGSGETWKRDVGGGVLLDRKGIWRQRMTPGQAWLVAQATRGLRREFGYVDQPAASASSILAAGLKEARVRFREARSSTGVVGAARHAGSVLKTLSAA
jgi:Sulfotransferase family